MLRKGLLIAGEIASSPTAADGVLRRVAPSLFANRGFASQKGQPQGRDPRDPKEAGSSPPPGDTEDVAPSEFSGKDTKVAGVASGVSARPSQPRKSSGTPPEWKAQQGDTQPPDSEKDLSRDPHEADIPEYPGINPKNQAEAESKDPRLPSAGRGGIKQAEKPPGNWPGVDSSRSSGFKGAQASPERSGGDQTPDMESQPGPTGGKYTEDDDIKDEDLDMNAVKWGKKPDTPVDPRSAYQNR